MEFLSLSRRRSSSRNVPSDEERGETDVFAGYYKSSCNYKSPLFLEIIHCALSLLISYLNCRLHWFQKLTVDSQPMRRQIVSEKLYCRDKDFHKNSLVSGLEITAGQQTMSGLIGELTSQLFVLPVMLTGHNRSYWKWNQLIWNPGWNTTRNVVYNLRIETDIGVHALSVTKLRIFSLLWVKQHRAFDWSQRKKVKFRGIFREIREKSGWYRGNFAEIFETNFAEKQ